MLREVILNLTKYKIDGYKLPLGTFLIDIEDDNTVIYPTTQEIYDNSIFEGYREGAWRLFRDPVSLSFIDKETKETLAVEKQIVEVLNIKQIQDIIDFGGTCFLEVEQHTDQHPDWRPSYNNPDDPPIVYFYVPTLNEGKIIVHTN